MATQPNHFSGAIVWKFVDGVLYFLTFTYHYHGKDQLKFPGGCGGFETEYPNDAPIDTLIRELIHETGLRLDNVQGVDTVYRKEVEGHTKHFYLIPFGNCAGSLRQKPIQDGEERLGVPEWTSVTNLSRWVFGGHRKAFTEALSHLVKEHSDIGQAHYDLIQ